MQSNDYRPLPIGSKIMYYDKERKLDMKAEVKASTVSFLWIVDVDTRQQSFIMYSGILEILELGTPS